VITIDRNTQRRYPNRARRHDVPCRDGVLKGAGAAPRPQGRRTAMMTGMAGMGWGMGLLSLVVVVLLVLGIAALVKYLFSGWR
jgi:predicted lipid-binding transport protein (Tim44 family)